MCGAPRLPGGGGPGGPFPCVLPEWTPRETDVVEVGEDVDGLHTEIQGQGSETERIN